MSHVLSIQDLSCVGRCSLTVALPVLSAMGHQCSVLPTAVLSTHTGFPGPEEVSLTGHLPDFARHWTSQGIRFDAVTVGYLSCPEQAAAVEQVVGRIPCPLILDPVLGDNGKLYRRITPDHIDALRKLFPRAKTVLPNVTEAAFLTGLPYRERAEEGYYEDLAAGLLSLGAESAVITGIDWAEAETGWYFSDGRTRLSYRGPRVPRTCHGTGDLFAAALTGAYLRGKSIPDAAALSAEFVRLCVENTPEATPMGPVFEPVLPWLWQQL